MKNFIDEGIASKRLEPYPKLSLITKLIDNQFENIYQEPMSTMDRLQQEYMTTKFGKKYVFNYKKGKKL
jgi:hypothetical protein